MFGLAFALLFSVIACAQYLFICHEVYSSTEQQLQNWAEQVADLIAFKDRWELTKFRRSADIQAPSVYVFSSAGTIIETTGFIPGLIGTVKPPIESIFEEPKSILTETGENWRLFARRLKGGVVILGILSSNEVKDPDELLKKTADQFGSSLETALKVRTGETSTVVDYSIIDDSGALRFAAEGIPLITDRVTVSSLASLSRKIKIGERAYLLHSRPIIDIHGKVVGMIVIPKDLTVEEKVLGKQVIFNLFTALIAWIVGLALVGVYLVSDEWQRRPQAASLDEALKNGESQSVEFKRGLADIHLAKAIAAFSNTNSGTIFLGVEDHCNVVGVDCASPTQKDHELQRLRDLCTQVIKPSVSVSADFVQFDGKVVVRVFVPRGDKPLYYFENEIYVREQTTSMRAKPEQVETIVAKFFREHRVG